MMLLIIGVASNRTKAKLCSESVLKKKLLVFFDISLYKMYYQILLILRAQYIHMFDRYTIVVSLNIGVNHTWATQKYMDFSDNV